MKPQRVYAINCAYSGHSFACWLLGFSVGSKKEAAGRAAVIVASLHSWRPSRPSAGKDDALISRNVAKARRGKRGNKCCQQQASSDL